MKFVHNTSITLATQPIQLPINFDELTTTERSRLSTFRKIKLYGVKMVMAPLNGRPVAIQDSTDANFGVFRRAMLVNERNPDKTYASSLTMRDAPNVKYYNYGSKITNWIKVKPATEQFFSTVAPASVTVMARSMPYMSPNDLDKNFIFGNTFLSAEAVTLDPATLNLWPMNYNLTYTYYFKCIGFNMNT